MMDSDADLTKGIAASSTPMEDHSIEFLIRCVEDFERTSQLETIDRLTKENSLLQHLVIAYQKHWSHTMDLLEQTQRALMTLQRALEHCMSAEIAAERDWLAFWGIRRGGDQLQKVSPGGWI